MRIEVSAGGYHTAAEGFLSGNQLADAHLSTLASRLGGSGGMAGNDAAAADFAAAYDPAVTHAVDAHTRLVTAFTTLGVLTTASAANHLTANRASVFTPRARPGRGQPDRADTARPVLDNHAQASWRLGYRPGYRRHLTSALGRDTEAGLPAEVTWVLDQIEGFVWPNAETDLLRSAGTALTQAATSVEGLDHSCQLALGALGRQHSAEIPPALRATRAVRTAVGDLGTAYRGLGTACDDYATYVEDHRQEILDLVLDLLGEAALVQGIGLILAPLTGGTTAAGAAALNATRIALLAPKVLAVLAKLKVAATAIARVVATITTNLEGLHHTLAAFENLPPLTSTPVATAPAPAAPPTPTPPPFPGGSLQAHERDGSHTIRKHVGKTEQELLDRFLKEPGLTRSSTFTDLATAEAAIAGVLRSKHREIAAWLTTAKDRTTIIGDPGHSVGRTAVKKFGQVHPADGSVTVVLARDISMPSGWRIWTAYPDF